eukprot:619074_1
MATDENAEYPPAHEMDAIDFSSGNQLVLDSPEPGSGDGMDHANDNRGPSSQRRASHSSGSELTSGFTFAMDKGLDVTKSGLSTAGQSLALGFGFMRKSLMSTFGRKADTPEEPDIVALIERLEKTRIDFGELLKNLKRFNSSETALQNSQISLGTKLKEMGPSGGLALGSSLVKYGEMMNVFTLHQQTLSVAFAEKFIAPIEALVVEDVDQIATSIRSYKIAKQDYDFASMQLGQNVSPGAKRDQAQQKLQRASDKYEQCKGDLKDLATAIDSRKSIEVQRHVDEFMHSQLKFVEDIGSYMGDLVARGG